MSLESLLSAFGLPGIVLGVALEGEGVAFLGGVLAHRGLFPVEAAAIAATLGAAPSDNASFGAGRFAGRARHVQRVLNMRTMGCLRAAFNRHPDAFILSFRFLYGAKVASAVLIGTTSVNWLRFLVLNFVSALVWAHLVTWLGYAGGAAIERLFGRLELHRHLLVALAAAVLVSVVALATGRWLRRRALPPSLGGS